MSQKSDDNDINKVQDNLETTIRKILTIYNKIMLNLIGLFSALNLIRDGHSILALLTIFVCSMLSNLYIHTLYCYHVHIYITEKDESVKFPLGEHIIPFKSYDKWLDANNIDEFNDYINQGLKLSDISLKYEVLDVEYIKTKYVFNMKKPITYKSKTSEGRK